jgi:hypothetical protein
MDSIATIRFVDDEMGSGHVIVRAGPREVALCVTFEKNGDFEIFLDPQTAGKVRDALSQGVARAARDN